MTIQYLSFIVAHEESPCTENKYLFLYISYILLVYYTLLDIIFFYFIILLHIYIYIFFFFFFPLACAHCSQIATYCRPRSGPHLAHME